MVYLNARSLLSNLKRLAFEFEIVQQYDYPEIIVVTESWLNNSIPNSLFNCSRNYNIFRYDRPGRTGGGVAILVKNNLRSYLIDLSNKFENLEACLVAIVHNKHKIFLGAVYKPSVGDVHLLKPLKEFLKFVSKKSGKHLIIGDFNLPDVNWDTLSAPSTGRQIDFMRSFLKFGFTQYVTEPTRGRNVLDLIFCNDPNLISNVSVDGTFNTSDHNIICANVSFPYTQSPQYRQMWNKGNYSDIINCMMPIDWKSIFSNCSDLSSMTDDFVNICHSVISDHVPQKLITKRPIKSRALKLALQNKAHLHKLRKRGINITKNRLNCATSAINKVIMEETARVEASLLSNPDVKKFYGYINSKLCSRHGYDSVTDRAEFISDARKAELFSAQFSSVFTLDNGDLCNFNIRPVVSDLNDVEFNFQNIRSALRNLQCKTSCGIDNLPSIFYKKSMDCLIQPLILIFQRSFETSEIPQSWKDAIVIPVYKCKGDKGDVSNYRPISMTPVACRIMESILKNSLVNHLARNNLVSSVQHGFLSKRSTLTNLLTCLNSWVECIDRRSCVDVMYLDIAKAFDSVSHSKLLHKISKYGVSGRFLLWIKAFLNNRRQVVKVNDSKSAFVPVTSGVPQGSVLGPILFLIYINDLAETLHDCSICIFADDSKMYFKADTTENVTKIQNDINRIWLWCKDWQLSVAATKCNILHIGRTNPRAAYNMGQNVIPDTSSIRDLGILISEDLGFSQHISKICSSALQRINLIFRAFTTRDRETLVKTYVTYVRPLVEYNSPVWSPSLLCDIEQIEKVQRYFTRRLSGLKNLSYKDRLDVLGLQTLEVRRIVIDLLEVFKIVKGISHLKFNDFFTFKLDSRTRGHKFQLRLRRIPRLDICKHFFSYRIVNVWNILPESVVGSSSTTQFRKSLKPDLLYPHCKFKLE